MVAAIVNAGLGNVKSIKRMIEFVGGSAEIVDDAARDLAVGILRRLRVTRDVRRDVVMALDRAQVGLQPVLLDAGPHTVEPAGDARVPNIYSTGDAVRWVYSLNADVRPGNSGGPLLTARGQVAGIVFARAEDQPNRGYAMGDAALRNLLARSGGLTSTVPSGHCTR